MELDRIAVTVRPRTSWEAIDLGFVMARTWFLPLWLLWLALALPVYLLSALFFNDDPVWAILVVWWCKPLYEPLLLFWLSRALFADQLGIGATLGQTFSVIRPQLLANLTWRRFNPNRSFNMPVAVLEKLRGKARKKRLGILSRAQQASIWLTLVGLLFEVILQLAAIFLIVIMLPEELRWLDLDNFLFNPGRLEQWLQHLADLLAMSLIAPFYVAAGFSLYLSRRTDLEAWDIEIAFRRLSRSRRDEQSAGQRRAPGQAALLLLCGALLGGGYAADLRAAAAVDRAEAKVLIHEVLKDPAFGKRESVTYWKYIGRQDDPVDDPQELPTLLQWILDMLEGFTRGFAAFGKALLLMVAGVLLGWLLYRAWLNRGYWVVRQPAEVRQKNGPSSLFGLSLEQDALPSDVAAACRDLLRQGDVRGALSLLYRGVLVALLEHDRLEIPDSATEYECVEQVRAFCPEEQASYFARLTRLWIATAYGHQAPEQQRMAGLCDEWERLFGGVSDRAQ